MKKASVLCFLVCCLFLLPEVAATFTFLDEHIDRDYGGGSSIKGSLELQLNHEPASSVLTSTFNGSITLLELLKRNNLVEGSDYTCSVPGCQRTYGMREGEITSTSIDNAQLIGFNITGREVYIQDADFLINSDSGVSCTRQLLIDLLDQGKTYVQNTQFSAGYLCTKAKNYGCFSPSLPENSYSSLKVTEQGLCERVHLEPAPAYELGALVKNTTTNLAVLKMELYDNETAYVGDCTLPLLQQEMQEVSCVVNRSVTHSGNYFVCLSSSSNSATYQIRAEESGAICGTANLLGSQEAVFDYELFTRPLPYSTLHDLSIKQAYQNIEHEDFGSYLDDYIEQTYGRNCTGGCILPFTFTGIHQTLTFTNASIVYEATPGNVKTYRKLNKIYVTNASISAPRVTIDLAPAQFTIPLTTSQKKFDLYLQGKRIFNTSLALTISPGFNFTITPRFAFLGTPTTFVALTNENITAAIWKFGDGSQLVTQGKIVSHTYTNTSNYTIEVTLTSDRGLSITQKFTLYAGNARESAERLLALLNTRVANLSFQIESYPRWIQPLLKQNINSSQLHAELATLTVASNASDAQYSELITSLLALRIPEGLASERKGTLPLALGLEGIDISYIEALSQYNISNNKRDELKSNIIYWIQQNYAPRIDFEVITLRDALSQDTPLLTFFTVTFNKQAQNTSEAYFIIDYPADEITFMKNYGQRALAGDSSSGTALLTNESSVSFFIAGEQDITQLGMYLSPLIPVLGTYSTQETTNPRLPLEWILLWSSLALILIFTLYIVLQEWYKKHYEAYLFKNPDDLYNSITFIHNSRIATLSDAVIRRKLSETGWRSEQIIYAFNKLDGKRTGMYEIPLFRKREQEKIQAEIAKRQQKGGDGRFIKRPGV